MAVDYCWQLNIFADPTEISCGRRVWKNNGYLQPIRFENFTVCGATLINLLCRNLRDSGRRFECCLPCSRPTQPRCLATVTPELFKLAPFYILLAIYFSLEQYLVLRLYVLRWNLTLALGSLVSSAIGLCSCTPVGLANRKENSMRSETAARLEQ
jgi:hypothetical protein